MTVPPLFGWENIATVVVVVVVVAITAVVLLQVGKDTTGRSEWQAWLDGRSADLRHPDPDDRASGVETDARAASGPSRSVDPGPSVVVRHRAAWRSPRS
jgi:hypothetical protein